MVFLTRSMFSWPRKISRHELELEKIKYSCVFKIYVKATQAILNLQITNATGVATGGRERSDCQGSQLLLLHDTVSF